MSVVLILVSAPVAYKVKFLDLGGAVSASILGIIVGAFLGPLMLILLMLFLGLNSAFTKVGYVNKALKGAAEPKGGARTWRSVVANGLPATLFSVAGHFFHPQLYVVGFLSSIAVASADTSATELGLLSKETPRLITNFSEVQPGTSGGVTGMGFLGALVGASVMALGGAIVLFVVAPRFFTPQIGSAPAIIGAAYDPQSMHLLGYLGAVIGGGFSGALIDSLLGATVQSKYACPRCERRTEKPVHCGTQAEKTSGLAFFDNDTVNLASCVAGALVGLAVYAIV